MGNGIIDIRESEISDMRAHLNKSSSNVANSASKISSAFSSFTKTGLFSNGANKIQKQMSEISASISVMGKNISKQHEKMVDTEKNLTIKANDIEIPNDFVTNDNSYSVSMSSEMLNKEDGNAIKKDETKKIDIDLQNSIEYNTNLKKYVKEYENKNGEIKIKGSNISLKNIKNDKKTTIDTKQNDSIIQKQMISKLSKDLNEKIPDLNMTLEIKSIPFKEIKKENQGNFNFEDNYRLIRSDFSSILANGNYTLINYEEK